MPQIKDDSPDFRGHVVPVPIEAMGEEDFAAILSTQYDLMLIGTQIKVWNGEGQLDLLAFDKRGALWVFEFKRDVAKPGAISQLLTYGAYAARLSRQQLEEIFEKSSPGKLSLEAAFKLKFGKALPETSRKTFLVLAAFDFSTACNRTLDFLQAACNLSIGRMKMKWVVSPRGVEKREFRYLELPSAINPLPSRASNQFAIVFYESAPDIDNWNLYRKSRLLILPEGEDPDDPHVPGYDRQSQRPMPYHKLRRGMGLFVYIDVYNVKDNPDDPQEAGHFLNGLVGYGVIQDDPHEITPDDLLVLRKNLKWVGDNFEFNHKGNPWCVQVEWDLTLPMKDALHPDFDIRNAPALALLDEKHARACFAALGLHKHPDLALFDGNIPF